MADTNHLHATPPVEGDGINYGGIVWFVVILTITTLVCQALVWGFFLVMEHRVVTADPARSPLSAPAGAPSIQKGQVMSGTEAQPQPALLVHEPTVLSDFRKAEDTDLSTYGWIDKTAGTVRLPIDEAKKLVLQRGLLHARPGSSAPAPAPGSAPATTPAPAAPAATH